MKKRYYTPPMTTTVNVKAGQSLMANSINVNSNGDAVDAGNAASRRRHSLWDDDDEEK